MSVRVRCLSLLLALVAWIAAPVGPRSAHAAASAVATAIGATATPGTIERGTVPTDTRARPDDLDDGTTPSQLVLGLAASARANERPLPDAPALASQHRSGQPRGPPVVV